MHVYAHAHAHIRQRLGNKTHKKRSAKNSTPYYLEYIYIKCRIQCGPYARRLRLQIGKICVSLRRLSQ